MCMCCWLPSYVLALGFVSIILRSALYKMGKTRFLQMKILRAIVDIFIHSNSPLPGKCWLPPFGSQSLWFKRLRYDKMECGVWMIFGGWGTGQHKNNPTALFVQQQIAAKYFHIPKQGVHHSVHRQNRPVEFLSPLVGLFFSECFG